MTPDQRREFLASRDFSVARQPFQSLRGPMWYMLELQPDGSRGNKQQREGRSYSVDLHSGLWTRWGDHGWFKWEQGPWNEQAFNVEQQPFVPFVDRCLEAGFVLDERQCNHIINGRDFGSRFARFGDRKFLLYPLTEEIIDTRFNVYQLDEFMKQNGGFVNQNGPSVGQTTEKVNRTAPIVNRPFVSMKDEPVEYSGANSQPVMF